MERQRNTKRNDAAFWPLHVCRAIRPNDIVTSGRKKKNDRSDAFNDIDNESRTCSVWAFCCCVSLPVLQKLFEILFFYCQCDGFFRYGLSFSLSLPNKPGKIIINLANG